MENKNEKEQKKGDESEEPTFADMNGYIYILENLKQRFEITDLERDALNFAIYLVTEFVISEGERPSEQEEGEPIKKDVLKDLPIKPMAGQLEGYV